MKPSGIGGQAVIEGVMMKNRDEYAVAVRKPNNEIEVVTHDCKSLMHKYKICNFTIIRGVIAFGESLVIGTKIMTYSASFFDDEEAMTEKEREKARKKESGRKASKERLFGWSVYGDYYYVIHDYGHCNLYLIANGIVCINRKSSEKPFCHEYHRGNVTPSDFYDLYLFDLKDGRYPKGIYVSWCRT